MREADEDMEQSKTSCSRKGEITDMCILGYEVETNGFHGGDAGHGGYLVIKFINVASVSIDATVRNTAGVNDTYNLDTEESVMITMRGDAEIRTTVKALKRIVEFLDKVLKLGQPEE